MALPPRKHLAALAAILLLAAGLRVAMLDRGAYAYPDELRHLNSVRAASHLLEGRLTAACHELSTTDARPGDAAIQLMPALAQQLVGGQRGAPRAASPASPPSRIPLLFQLAVSLGLIVMVHALACRFLGDRPGLAALGTLVYALLGNSNAYIRHILPYDTSLLLFLGALWIALGSTPRVAAGSVMACGLLTGLGFAVYPGYYLFPILVFGALLVQEWNSTHENAGWASAVRQLVLAGIGAAAVAALFEIVARIAGRSYFVDLRALSDTINQGSFEEGFSFFFEYLLRLESPVGPLLLVLAALGFLVRLRATGKDDRRVAPLAALAGLAGLCFVYHAFSSVVLHKMVFYGRLVHMYVPFLIWCAVAGIAGIANQRLQRVVAVTLAAASIVTFVLFAREFYPLAYPADVIRAQADRISSYAVERVALVQESTSDPRYGDFTAQVRALARSRSATTDERLVMVNFGFFYPVLADDYRPYRPAPAARLLYDGRHWLTHPVYTYEGNTIEERRLLGERRYRVALFAEPAP